MEELIGVPFSPLLVLGISVCLSVRRVQCVRVCCARDFEVFFSVNHTLDVILKLVS
jgi:hypothetical protein